MTPFPILGDIPRVQCGLWDSWCFGARGRHRGGAALPGTEAPGPEQTLSCGKARLNELIDVLITAWGLGAWQRLQRIRGGGALLSREKRGGKTPKARGPSCLIGRPAKLRTLPPHPHRMKLFRVLHRPDSKHITLPNTSFEVESSQVPGMPSCVCSAVKGTLQLGCLPKRSVHGPVASEGVRRAMIMHQLCAPSGWEYGNVPGVWVVCLQGQWKGLRGSSMWNSFHSGDNGLWGLHPSKEGGGGRWV